MPRITGKLLNLEPVSGTSNSGESYAYMRAYILDGLEVHPCRVSDTFGELPPVGSDVDVVATVRASNNGRIYWTAVRPVSSSDRKAA